jgi:hypothetical protein
VLSFTYALYCDLELAQQEHAKWELDHSYRGYLDFYKADPTRPFPEQAEDIIAEWVSRNPRTPTGLFMPTREQSWDFVPHLIDELTGKPVTPPSPPPPPPSVDRTPAAPSAERPLLSCLACIFVNQDQTYYADRERFLCDFGLRDESLRTLRSFAELQAPVLTPGQALSLSAALVDELVKMPAVW